MGNISLTVLFLQAPRFCFWRPSVLNWPEDSHYIYDSKVPKNMDVSVKVKMLTVTAQPLDYCMWCSLAIHIPKYCLSFVVFVYCYNSTVLQGFCLCKFIG